ncbi:hypothetical protein [Vreelandella gomseomensis]|uniref:Uncharacterized protein n=1 Tax=Vreelandella gomseomensis TaxID=370766 RepID=A0ABU1G8A8_9GAMM|nr:hypothetical protein [Halomonas gomseomensis]MDR5873299.1 hypothetical protein [Halomonas gomseomensis]
MNREIFQKQYDFELEQRNGIASATNTPIVALTILGGALTSIINGFNYNYNLVTYYFIGCIVLSAVSMLVCIYKVVRTFLGYSYQKVPAAKELKHYLNQLKDWHNSNGSDEASAYKDFDEYFDERLSEAADFNSQNNIARGNYLHDATAAVVIAFIFLFAASPSYVYQKVSHKETVYQVHLTNEENVMAENESGNNGQQSNPTPSAAPVQNPSAAPKPTGPQNVVFKGNTKGNNVQASNSSGSDKNS